MSKLFKYNVPALLWIGVIYYLLTMPGDDLPAFPWMAVYHIDKLIHAGLFFVLSALFVVKQLYYPSSFNKTTLLLLIGCLSASYGVVMEYLQPLITANRVSDVFDALANVVGAFAGALLLSRVG